MTTSITLAGPDDHARVMGLMERNIAETGQDWDPVTRERALAPLLDGSPHGAIWLIGPVRAPLGYVLVSFGWSISLGGSEGWVDEVFIRPSVRRRGIGTEVLHAIAVALSKGGVKALHVRLPDAATVNQRFCERVGFAHQPDIRLMSDVF